nr:hypothetical protein [Paenibacillus periandrae]
MARAKDKLADRERITAESFEKLGRRAKTQAVFAELPVIILEFAAQYKARCIKWLLDGAEKYQAHMIEVNAIQDRNERNKARATAYKAFGGTCRSLSIPHRRSSSPPRSPASPAKNGTARASCRPGGSEELPETSPIGPCNICLSPSGPPMLLFET